MNIRLAHAPIESIVDGPGFRLSVFMQGCSRDCPGCHNPQSHDPGGGFDTAVLDLLMTIRDNPLLDGVTFTGGEPLDQIEPLKWFTMNLLGMGLSVWVYSGYTWEELTDNQRDALNFVDVLVDGPFIEDQKSMDLKFRGSTNQRIIDVQKSLKKGEVVLWCQ